MEDRIADDRFKEEFQSLFPVEWFGPWIDFVNTLTGKTSRVEEIRMLIDGESYMLSDSMDIKKMRLTIGKKYLGLVNKDSSGKPYTFMKVRWSKSKEPMSELFPGIGYLMEMVDSRGMKWVLKKSKIGSYMLSYKDSDGMNGLSFWL